MPRPSRNYDRLLIATAIAMIPRTGLVGLKVRPLCARAGINPGMFHYHFRSKREFSRRVMSELYETFFAKVLDGVAAATGGPRDRLRRAVITIIRFVRDHRRIILPLILDGVGGDPEVLAFARKNFPRHFGLVVGLLRQCQRAGLIRRMPIPSLLPMFVGGIAAPVAGFGMLERILPAGIGGVPLAVLRGPMISDRAVEERIDLMLAALAPSGRPR